MDYGQPVNTPTPEQFFTAGVGNAPETNNPDIRESLGTDTYSTEQSSRKFGNIAMNPSEQITPEPSLENQNSENPQEQLGKIVDLETLSKNSSPQEVKPAESLNFDKTTIKTTKKLSEAGIKAIEKSTNQLSQTGNVYNFYEEIRGEGGLVDSNLDNSYGRKLAA